jgi:hypothetical protein
MAPLMLPSPHMHRMTHALAARHGPRVTVVRAAVRRHAWAAWRAPLAPPCRLCAPATAAAVCALAALLLAAYRRDARRQLAAAPA